MFRRVWLIFVLVSAVLLSGCESSEERAERHFRNAEELIAAGDLDRALIELRNTIKYSNFHKDARYKYAEIKTDRGDLGDAIGNYRILVDKYPDDVMAHQLLGRLEFRVGDIEAAVETAKTAYQLTPDDPAVKAIYSMALLQLGDREDATEMALNALQSRPEDELAHSVVIASALDQQDFETALARTDAALLIAPEDEGLHVLRLSVLEQLGREDDLGPQLHRLVELFPENTAHVTNLVRWHLANNDRKAAEDLLRKRAETGGFEESRELIRFLFELQGETAATTELQIRIEGTERPEDRLRYQRLLAGMDFEAGRRDKAVADLSASVQTAAPGEEKRDSQVTLAKMLFLEGREEEGDDLIRQVLEADASMVEALKIHASRLIGSDRTDEAIRDLRLALDQAPQDAEILTLMAEVHQREGAHELSGERLALAVEVSGNAVPETLRYARYLLEAERVGPAEAVVIDALRRRPEDADLLTMLAEIHLARRDHARVEQIAAILAEQPDPAAAARADRLRAANLATQQKTGELVGLLQSLTSSDADDLGKRIGLVQAYLGDGRMSDAEGAIAEIVRDFPDDPSAKLLEAGFLALQGQGEKAEAAYRAIIADHPKIPRPYIPAFALLQQLDRAQEAMTLLDQGIAETDDPELLFIKAGELERQGDFEGAIAIYEDLYTRDTSDMVIANNLASLISTHRDGVEDLERAHLIARRLRGTEVPPFQDTYGWILARRGQYQEALGYLEDAARAMTDDPLVQFHLGMAQSGAGQANQAIETLSRAIEIAGPDTSLPQMATARQEIDRLKSAPADDTN